MNSPAHNQDAAQRKFICKSISHWCRQILVRQVRAAESDVDDVRNRGWSDGRQAGFNLARLAACRVYADELELDGLAIDHALLATMKFLTRRQAPDGRLDLNGVYSCNEVGFVLPGLVEAYERLRDPCPAVFAEIAQPLQAFLQKGAQAVVAGQAYTSNHRWAAACAGLASVHSLWPDEQYLKKINDYLSDGIDCDDDGFWFEERSPNYNMVADHGLIVMADRLGRPDLLEPVRRNLLNVIHMTQPNGEADTSFSHRQDRAVPDCPTCVYGIARRMALETGDGRFTTLAGLALRHEQSLCEELMPLLFSMARKPGSLPAVEALPQSFEYFYPARQLARVRDQQTALTLTADEGGHYFDTVLDQWGGVRLSDDWIHLHHGGVVIQSIHVVPAGGFAIQPQHLTQSGEGDYRLDGHADGWTHTLHFRPERPTLWMDVALTHSIHVTRVGRTLRVKIDVNSPNLLIASLQIWVRAGVQLTSDSSSHGELIAGTTVDLDGGEVLRLGRGTSEIRIVGLPQSEHTVRLAPPQPIPSAMRRHCAALSIGLTMPVKLDFSIELGND